MTEVLKKNRIACVIMALSFIAALLLCGVRFVMEARNTEVCIIMSTSDAALLDGELPDSIRLFDGGDVLDGALLLVEDEAQYSCRPIGDISESEHTNGDGTLRRVRCFKLDGDYAARYGVLGYEGAEEIVNMLYRAVTDRNIRVVWLTPFVDGASGEVITDADVYAGVVQSLFPRLERQGLTLGEDFSLLPEYTPSLWLSAAVFLGVLAAYWLLIQSVFSKLLPHLICFAAVCAAAPAAWLLGITPTVFAVPALLAAVAFPCLALWYMTEKLAAARGDTTGRELGGYLGLVCAGVGICIAGGIFVGALETSTDYLLAMDNFWGVKLSQLAPLSFAAYAVLRFLCPPREILRGKRYILALAAVLLVAGVGYYILRTGNADVSALEQRFRNRLESLLIARPRTKEAFVAWPCLAISFILCARGKREYCWPFAILTSAGFASVVNTFCHARSPLWLSLTRSLTGLIIGAGIGCVLICLFRPRNDNIPRRDET